MEDNGNGSKPVGGGAACVMVALFMALFTLVIVAAALFDPNLALLAVFSLTAVGIVVIALK